MDTIVPFSSYIGAYQNRLDSGGTIADLLKKRQEYDTAQLTLPHQIAADIVKNQNYMEQLPMLNDLNKQKLLADITESEEKAKTYSKPVVSESDKAYQKALGEARANEVLAKTPGTKQYDAAKKLKDAEKQQALGLESNLQNARDVMSATQEAKNNVGWWSNGLVGQVLSGVGGTDAMRLKTKIDPIIANLGFDRLQQMRDQSKTGGALGSIAVKELDMLQSTVASLNQAQSEEDLNAALDKVYKHYGNWVKTMEAAKANGELGGTMSGSVGGTESGASTQAQLLQDAQTAIQNGADPAKVKARLQQLMQGQ